MKTPKSHKKPVKREQLRTVSKKKIMLKQLVINLGNITNACRAADIDRKTYYKWLEKDKAFREATEAIPEMRLDHYEAQLDKLIDEGNVAALIFALKAKGKKRGWIEKQEHEVKGDFTLSDVKVQFKLPKEFKSITERDYLSKDAPKRINGRQSAITHT